MAGTKHRFHRSPRLARPIAAAAAERLSARIAAREAANAADRARRAQLLDWAATPSKHELARERRARVVERQGEVSK